MTEDWDDHDHLMSQRLTQAYKKAAQERKRWLSGTADRLSRMYNIKNPKVFKMLLAQLRSLSLDPSTPNFEKWTIPKDLQAWKQSREKLTSLAADLRSAVRRLGEIMDDRVLFAALRHCDPNRALPQLIGPLHEIAAIAAEAASMSGTKGNRPLPDWQREAVTLCRKFWREHQGEDPKAYFNPIKKPKRGERAASATTEAGNRFSKWFCDVMAWVSPGLTISQCVTLLREEQKASH